MALNFETSREQRSFRAYGFGFGEESEFAGLGGETSSFATYDYAPGPIDRKTREPGPHRLEIQLGFRDGDGIHRTRCMAMSDVSALQAAEICERFDAALGAAVKTLYGEDRRTLHDLGAADAQTGRSVPDMVMQAAWHAVSTTMPYLGDDRVEADVLRRLAREMGAAAGLGELRPTDDGLAFERAPEIELIISPDGTSSQSIQLRRVDANDDVGWLTPRGEAERPAKTIKALCEAVCMIVTASGASTSDPAAAVALGATAAAAGAVTSRMQGALSGMVSEVVGSHRPGDQNAGHNDSLGPVLADRVMRVEEGRMAADHREMIRIAGTTGPHIAPQVQAM